MMAVGFGDKFLRSLSALASAMPDAAEFNPVFVPPHTCSISMAPWVLLVVAHPDDESECAAVLYKVTHELGGIVDELIVTDGAGGNRYSLPAEKYYRIALRDAHKSLVRIRREEAKRAARVLGIRRTMFLDQPDPGFTCDASEGLRAWNTSRIRTKLRELLETEDYDVVLVLHPAADTYGHHQTVAQLVSKVAADIDPFRRPALAGVLTTPTGSAPNWTFDRHAHIAGDPTGMDYTIVAHWVIAEHKSQGAFQMEYGRRTQEYYWLFDVSGDSGRQRWKRFCSLVNDGPTEHELASNRNTTYALPPS
jgi:LmbE family N-acetylglucosaminyl deacetylase